MKNNMLSDIFGEVKLMGIHSRDHKSHNALYDWHIFNGAVVEFL